MFRTKIKKFQNSFLYTIFLMVCLFIMVLFGEGDWEKIFKELDDPSADIFGETILRGTVIRVVDGDTIKILIDGQEETVRLIGVDTPETKHPSKDVECFGEEASAYVSSILRGKNVLVELDETQGIRDKYERILGYVYVDNIGLEGLVNYNIISNGYGYEYTYSRDYKYKDEFELAMKNAKSYSIGLWDENTCSGNR